MLKNGSLQGRGKLVGLNMSGFFSLELWNMRSTLKQGCPSCKEQMW